MRTQSLNQFGMTGLIGTSAGISQPNVIVARFNPSSAAVGLPAGSAVKLIAGTSKEILVDVAAATDEVYGVTSYQVRKNTALPGDRVEVFLETSIIWLESNAAIARGAKVSFVPATFTGSTQSTDPRVKTAVSTEFAIGRALDVATAAGQLIRVEVKPSTEALA